MTTPLRSPTFTPGYSRGFGSWLAENRISLAVSTYEIGKLMLVGTDSIHKPCIFERTLDQCMGLHAVGDALYAATRTRVVRFRDSGAYERWDRRYLPRIAWYTGAIDAHDLSLDAQDRPVVVATAFNCVGRTSVDHSFEPIWWPRFLDKPLPGDRCHLNGMCTEDGEVAVVTLSAPSGVPDGWRRNRFSTGQVVDARTHRVLADGLAMPHSPRLHDGRLWFLESARGRLWVIEDGSPRVVGEVRGFARGLAFIGPYAIIGTSAPRTNAALTRTPVELQAEKMGYPLLCGVTVLDTRDGRVAQIMVLDGGLVREVFDVAVLADTIRPMAIGFQGEEIADVVDMGGPAPSP